jgi:uncharacterized membrane protein
VTWLRRYHLRHFVGNSFWFVPALAMVAAVPAMRFVLWLDTRTQWRLLGYSVEGAQAILSGLSSSMLTFIVFAVSGLLLAVQIASGQLTPRIISLVFARPMLRVSVGIFVFSYSFTLGALGRVEMVNVPELLVTTAVLFTLVSIGVFFWFVQALGTGLRPVFILQGLWDTTLAVVDRVYPQSLDAGGDARPVAAASVGDGTPRIVLHTGASGTFLAFGARELVALARRAGCVLELVPQVGDFVAHGDPLFRIHPGEARVDERALYGCVAFGPERTLEQDPAFAFRIMVDIAARALSPAVNDPTTAVLAIDQIHRLLALIGQRNLDSGPVRDAQGHVRLVYATPDWEDFVTLAVSEIRAFGASSIQIPRRLHAMFEHLIEVLPASRAPAVRRELTLLERAVERQYAEDEDRRRARHPDRQGLGGTASSAVRSGRSV